ncbi:putative acyltransferase [Colletotrichum sidae]|uniref:1-acyl-sn-glycerol-3-phosphate acyltransferase n=4 Tax=Colletotrichum orbiculare species complex TaxID=2707354 RepID=N4UQ31_COLOR|nr:putative acyltransferase [Colletotrichum orbiculare MAFF 240422]TDZ29427.1 putative acyltransferase [Colletotrichum spinosum]TDZ35756.1 putative acyltransferase [Colletotrichum trifolii]TEA11205.1 putative acyltransferase [Colletotrichum sidae]
MWALLGYIYTFCKVYVLVVVALYMLSFVVPKAAFGARVLASYVSLMLAAGYGVFASIFLRIVGNPGIAQWAAGRAFYYIMALTVGVTFEIEDPKNILATTRPAVFIGNHQTELDVLMLGAMFPKYCSVTAKASLKKTPVLGWFMSLSGSIFIDRKNTKDAREAMAGAANEIVKRKQSVYMFPEGTRSYAKDPVLLPFKKGAFHLAVQAGVPIVPVVVANYSHVLWLKGLVFNSGKIPVKVLDPIPTAGLTAADVDDLTRKSRDLMLEELVKLSEKAQGRPMKVPAAHDGTATAKTTGSDATDTFSAL